MKKSSPANAKHQHDDRHDNLSISNSKSALEEDMSLDQLFDPCSALSLTASPDKETATSSVTVSYESCSDVELFDGDNGSDIGGGIIEYASHVFKEIHEQHQKTCEPTMEALAPPPMQGVNSVSQGVRTAVKSPLEKQISPKKLTNEITVDTRVEDRQADFCPVTMKLTNDSICHLLEAAERDSRGVFQSWLPCGVVGLHTCGELASTILEFFSQVPSARVVCVVGCCYHHITEVDEETSKWYGDK